jgi:hypothetical protein
MQTMKSLQLILVLAVLGLSLSACDMFEQRDRTYQGDPQIEFAPLSETVDEGDGTVTTSIQLIGEQRDSALPVSFTVGDQSTAVEGTHYTLGSTSTSIPANANSVDVTIEVLDNDQDDGDTNYELFLTLQDSDNVQAAENLKTFTLTIRGTDEE